LCSSNPDEYLFWDALHPSVVAHQVVVQAIIEELSAVSE
jgi:phospholipase/lecithinase/hemolysin